MALESSTGCGLISGVVTVLIVYLNVFKNNGIAVQDRAKFNVTRALKVPRILCWIPTIPTNYKTRVLAVQETWVPDCDVILFFSETSEVTIPVIGLGIPENRDNLARKTMAALRYIYKHHYDQADWFLKADDDTYVIMNNLRYFLSQKDPSKPYYYGSTFSKPRLVYNSGGGGYVMSRMVLKTLVESSETFQECGQDGNEDKHIAGCLRTLGIVPGPSTDDNGLEVFHWSNPHQFLKGSTDTPYWVRRYQSFWKYNGPNKGSKVSATFHKIDPGEMRAFDFILSNMTVYGYKKAKYSVRKR